LSSAIQAGRIIRAGTRVALIRCKSPDVRDRENTFQ